MTGRAVISPDDVYRYTLEREWPRELGQTVDLRCLFIMLNPSTADATADDPTIKRCVGFARSWGYTSLSVVNLFAFRATDPMKLLEAADPVGPDNDSWILTEAARAHLIVAAWGTHGYYECRDEAVLNLLADTTRSPVYCLGVTRMGYPRHPLYMDGAVVPQRLP